ncbi:aspartate aminotransferase family protein [Amycolatopsis umgeniensis]|uniref:Acetylornithine/succinyldiaminopimelate/putresci ne aminotransferase n=1 Tax=Amycolatopsis umgeniensis TaxID=336628 RepID=A0A841BF44_9PSEU|nr:aminotransferase class III-fold pyridoxal phosphate-dependent enzyme [Amycolatopsis umgeniensis]MBB5857521.1 acetylornithine/succinyldiaminopimelate/putrescine aminotransferase [Amycolatopsis umgeniensis]
MNGKATEPEITEPNMRALLGSVGLDVEYLRAEGNTLVHAGADGEDVSVLDHVGGYGSLLLGHNNPEIVAHAKELLDARTPVHIQFSRHSSANRLALALNRILHRELGTTEDYLAFFASTGAEAVETGIKHAELDRRMRVGALIAEIDSHIEEVRAASRDGGVTVGAELGFAGPEELIAHVRAHNEAVLAKPPLFLALEGSFHGKLAGSVQLTHNPVVRGPFQALAAQARFVPIDQPDALAKVVDSEQAALLDLKVDGGVVTVEPREYPVFTAFLVEPVQGEGGINVLGEEFATRLRRTADALDVPVIVDEIQCGMGRTGTFLAGSAVGLQGDYYTLAKSLGGGIAKISLLLIRRSKYRPDFEFLHSSTFAKDGFSTAIALKVVELLEADDGAAYRRATELGIRLKSALDGVRADFPEVVKAVRGKGLMLGLEFGDQTGSPSEPVRDAALQGILGYAIAGYLLREHRIRIFPTASAPNTLRFEPSLQLTGEEIARTAAALRAVSVILRDQPDRIFQP